MKNWQIYLKKYKKKLSGRRSLGTHTRWFKTLRNGVGGRPWQFFFWQFFLKNFISCVWILTKIHVSNWPKKSIKKLEIPKVIVIFRKQESVYGARRTVQSKFIQKWQKKFQFFFRKIQGIWSRHDREQWAAAVRVHRRDRIGFIFTHWYWAWHEQYHSRTLGGSGPVEWNRSYHNNIMRS